MANYVTLFDEEVPAEGPITLFDPLETWKCKIFEDVGLRPMMKHIFEKGKCIYQCPKLSEIRDYCAAQATLCGTRSSDSRTPTGTFRSLLEQII